MTSADGCSDRVAEKDAFGARVTRVAKTNAISLSYGVSTDGRYGTQSQGTRHGRASRAEKDDSTVEERKETGLRIHRHWKPLETIKNLSLSKKLRAAISVIVIPTNTLMAAIGNSIRAMDMATTHSEDLIFLAFVR